MTLARQRGQSTVEFALIIPLVMVVVLMVVQIALVIYVQLTVSYTAHEVARVLSINPQADIGQLTPQFPLLGDEKTTVETRIETSGTIDQSFIFVAISHEVRPISRLFQPFFENFVVVAEAKMVLEI